MFSQGRKVQTEASPPPAPPGAFLEQSVLLVGHRKGVLPSSPADHAESPPLCGTGRAGCPQGRALTVFYRKRVLGCPWEVAFSQSLHKLSPVNLGFPLLSPFSPFHWKRHENPGTDGQRSFPDTVRNCEEIESPTFRKTLPSLPISFLLERKS